MKRHRKTGATTKVPACPRCERRDHVAHAECFLWACMRCRLLIVGRLFEDGDPYLAPADYADFQRDTRQAAAMKRLF